MRHVGIREFRARATALLSAGETLVIERHGTPVGFFIPVAAVDREQGRTAMGRLADVLDALQERTGLSEEELATEVLGRT